MKNSEFSKFRKKKNQKIKKNLKILIKRLKTDPLANPPPKKNRTLY